MQRLPQELGDIGWVVDRKDRKITQMEETWSTLILLMSERYFGGEPLIRIAGEDYSHFDARYGFTEATADPESVRHFQWLNSRHGRPPSAVGTDLRRLLTEQQIFEDSRLCLGLQLADMLASILRRALNDRLQLSGWKDFGGLLVRQELDAGFIRLVSGSDTYMHGRAEWVCEVLYSRAKDSDRLR